MSLEKLLVIIARFPFVFVPHDSTVGAVFTVLAMPLNFKSLENAL